LAGAARIVLRDWSIGRFDRYTTPPATIINTATATAQTESSVTEKLDNITPLYVNDEAILSSIMTRKERRKQGGLVKFACGSIESRKVAVEEPWNGLEQNIDEESDDDDDEVDDEGMVVDGEDEEEENEDEEDEEEDEKSSDAETGESQDGEEEDDDADQDDEIELPRPSHKQKRKRGPENSVHLPQAKKVSFSATPPARARGTKFDHRQKLGRPTTTTTKGNDKLKESRSKPIAKSATKPVHKSLPEKKSKIANVTAKIKAKGGATLASQKDKSESEAYDFGKFF
jgi:nuclear GTP-binding protein